MSYRDGTRAELVGMLELDETLDDWAIPDVRPARPAETIQDAAARPDAPGVPRCPRCGSTAHLGPFGVCQSCADHYGWTEEGNEP